MFRFLSCAFILILSSGYSVAQKKLTHTVYFELDKAEITPLEEEKLGKWLSSINDTAKRVDVIGFTDFLGSDTYNVNLSERRANAVMELIESNRSFHYRMSFTEAKGESASTDNGSIKGIPSDRKVVVTVTLLEKVEAQKTVDAPPVNPDTTKPEQPDSAPHLLTKMEVGQTIVLKNLNFFPGRHFLVPKALPELERLIEVLKENPNLEIEIQGHICCKLDSIDGLDVNTKTYTLSANRAEYIYDQLVLAGIDGSRIKHRGFAGSRPLIVPEKTAEDRARNRRVEIKVLKK